MAFTVPEDAAAVNVTNVTTIVVVVFDFVLRTNTRPPDGVSSVALVV
jgi:hypothetical protein